MDAWRCDGWMPAVETAAVKSVEESRVEERERESEKESVERCVSEYTRLD
jgi:predicted RNase H-like nuclease (RuvC/YqgF family)